MKVCLIIIVLYRILSIYCKSVLIHFSSIGYGNIYCYYRMAYKFYSNEILWFVSKSFTEMKS